METLVDGLYPANFLEQLGVIEAGVLVAETHVLLEKHDG